MKNNIEKILILAPHTDDGELGCGGSIARFIEEGENVFYAAFSTAEESVDPKLPNNILEIEEFLSTHTYNYSDFDFSDPYSTANDDFEIEFSLIDDTNPTADALIDRPELTYKTIQQNGIDYKLNRQIDQ